MLSILIVVALTALGALILHDDPAGAGKPSDVKQTTTVQPTKK